MPTGPALESSSPRPWGCFQCHPRQPSLWMVFPTPVGCFLAGAGNWNCQRVFPTPVGVFLPRTGACHRTLVFPTPVGVFLLILSVTKVVVGLPHARGGVSSIAWIYCLTRSSSPRPWGCFRWKGRLLRIRSVFPTPVGVFLRYRGSWICGRSLPHARGGVSGCIVIF